MFGRKILLQTLTPVQQWITVFKEQLGRTVWNRRRVVCVPSRHQSMGVIYGGVMVSDGDVMVVYGDSSVGGHGLLGKWGAEDDL